MIAAMKVNSHFWDSMTSFQDLDCLYNKIAHPQTCDMAWVVPQYIFTVNNTNLWIYLQSSECFIYYREVSYRTMVTALTFLLFCICENIWLIHEENMKYRFTQSNSSIRTSFRPLPILPFLIFARFFFNKAKSPAKSRSSSRLWLSRNYIA